MSTEQQLSPDQFAIGEIAIVNAPGCPIHGHEVEVIEPLEYRTWSNFATGEDQSGMAYGVRGQSYVEGWIEWCVQPKYLRKKRPPAEDRKLVSWDSCPWQPESLHV